MSLRSFEDQLWAERMAEARVRAARGIEQVAHVAARVLRARGVPLPEREAA